MKSTCKVLLENQANLETESKGQGRRKLVFMKTKNGTTKPAEPRIYCLSFLLFLAEREIVRHQGKAVLRGP